MLNILFWTTAIFSESYNKMTPAFFHTAQAYEHNPIQYYYKLVGARIDAR